MKLDLKADLKKEKAEHFKTCPEDDIKEEKIKRLSSVPESKLRLKREVKDDESNSKLDLKMEMLHNCQLL